ncbi:MAG: hypothetical protein ACFFC7_25445 [Candidatus Hermodarchaeota archaeon]
MFRYKIDHLHIIEAIEFSYPIVDADILPTVFGFLVSGSHRLTIPAKEIIIWFPNVEINTFVNHKSITLDSPLKEDFLTTLLGSKEPLKRQEYFPSSHKVVIGTSSSMLDRLVSRLEHEIRQKIETINKTIAKTAQRIHDFFPSLQLPSFPDSNMADSSPSTLNYYTIQFINKEPESNSLLSSSYRYRCIDTENLLVFIKKIERQGFEIRQQVLSLKEPNQDTNT